jgi:hypothetical protein
MHPHQTITIHTDSSAAIHIIEKPLDSTKKRVRHKYHTERNHIQCQLDRKQIKLILNKVKAHSGEPGNERADEEAKKGTDSILTYTIPSTIPQLTHTNGQPISDDPRHWLKRYHHTKHLLIWQHQQAGRNILPDLIPTTDWITTQLAWQEEGPINSGKNTFEGARTRTFKTKLLHQQLPTATRKQLYNPSYPTNQCLHCNQIETTAHILECNFTIIRLGIIFSNIIQNIPNELNTTAITTTLNTTNSNQYQAIIKGLVLSTWTDRSPSNPTSIITIRTAAAKLTNHIISQFRQFIWNSWCKMRKQWEKDNPQLQRSAHQPITTSQHSELAGPNINLTKTLEQILEGFIEPPIIVSSYCISQTIAPLASSLD